MSCWVSLGSGSGIAATGAADASSLKASGGVLADPEEAREVREESWEEEVAAGVQALKEMVITISHASVRSRRQGIHTAPFTVEFW